MTTKNLNSGEDATDLENTPLTPVSYHRSTTQYYSFAAQGGTNFHSAIDNMKYDQGNLLSWWILIYLRGSAMDNFSTWSLVAKMLILSIIVGLSTCYIDLWKHLDTTKFQKLGDFLNVFVGLMLGFFLSLQMNRWFACASGFLELFDAVRNLQLQCVALGVSKERTSTVVRYGVLSVWLLYFDLVVKSHHVDGAVEDLDEKVWDDFASKRTGLVTPSERKMLQATAEPASCIWTWVSSFIGRMAQDGDIPSMPTPTYGRMMNLAQSAHAAIRHIRANVLVQAPYVYAHMLALLVHCNNILNCISFGMTLGVIFSQRFGRHQSGLFQATQDTVVSFFLNLLAPFLYQAILEVSLAVARPFSHEDGMIPIPDLIESLERDLLDCAKLADSPPAWEKPAFKQPE